MTKKVYYIEYTNEAEKAIERVTNELPTFVEVEAVEMNFVRVEIDCRIEDVKTIERILEAVV